MAARARLPLQSLLHKRLSLYVGERVFHTETAVKEPAYPPVLPSLTAKSKSSKSHRLHLQHERVRAADVQEKLSLLTRIQRMKYVVRPQTITRDADKWYQHFTKTAYIPGLPDKFTITDGGSEDSPAETRKTSAGVGEETLAEIRALVSHAILQENWYLKKRRAFVYRRQAHLEAPFLRNLGSGVTNIVAKHNPVLRLSNLAVDPQVNFYWMRGEWTIPRGHRAGRVEPVRFQIDDKPHSQIRIPEQLPQFTPMETSYAAEVPEFKCTPDKMPLFKRQYENNIFTGAKLPDPVCYGHTQFHLVPDMCHRTNLIKRRQADQVEVFLRANGLCSLFAWTGAQAMYQGFWSQEDVTRPFVSQAVITDGQFFSFFCYQLNTLALSLDVDADNPRKNLFWGTESMRLYEAVQDGEVVGLDDRVLDLLVQFLMNKP
ncbi:39S ribosomal protein S30, mitochondrial [Lampris incognitus]|uniref:39S ribosomal protein S30, mitochondrial n=1 Tax=Lampris incognitus TaxID=2546036 RepID=UPI0024B4817E|nr:39S ribosomal protein S30, mitochondrial [Lampris incognitus]